MEGSATSIEPNALTVYVWIALTFAIGIYMMSPKLRELMKDSRVKKAEKEEAAAKLKKEEQDS